MQEVSVGPSDGLRVEEDKQKGQVLAKAGPPGNAVLNTDRSATALLCLSPIFTARNSIDTWRLSNCDVPVGTELSRRPSENVWRLPALYCISSVLVSRFSHDSTLTISWVKAQHSIIAPCRNCSRGRRGTTVLK